MLRRWLIGLGVLYLVVGAYLLSLRVALVLAIYLVLGGAVLAGSIVLERRGYRPRVDRARGRWQRTGERFVDPSTGRLMEVRYNPDTGERDYVDVDTPS
jgi:hypothetical protein